MRLVSDRRLPWRRGLGQDDGSNLDLCSLYPAGCISTGGGGGGGGIDWTRILTQGITAGTKIGQNLTNPIYNLPPGYYLSQGPYGTVVSTAGAPAGALGTSLTSGGMMPLLLLGGGLLVFMMMAKK
jgi:hypothetical protein